MFGCSDLAVYSGGIKTLKARRHPAEDLVEVKYPEHDIVLSLVSVPIMNLYDLYYSNHRTLI
jgi:hypothetical protein